MESEQIKQKVDELEKLAGAYYLAAETEKQAKDEREGLRDEILLAFSPGLHTTAGYVVEVKKQERAPTIDWKKVIVELNGEKALEDILAQQKLTEKKPVFIVSVKPLGNKQEEF